MDATFCFKCVIVALMYLAMSADPVNGSSCTNNTHTCTTGIQRCVEQNNTAGFVCECAEIDQQLDPLANCTAIPESQRLYIAVPLNITGVDRDLIAQTINDPRFAELVEGMLQIRSLPSFKGLKFLNAFIEFTSAAYPTLEYMLLFTQNVTTEILLATAHAVLMVEARETLLVNNLTVPISGHTGIFTNKDDIQANVDAVDWCVDPNLYTCPEKTKCRDEGLRYQCSCATGFFLDGDRCTDVVVRGTSPFQTDGTRDLPLLCDVGNATEVTKYAWSGATCMRTENVSCVIRPQPPWDDGMNVTCAVTYRNGQSASATFVINLTYPPKSAPVIEGYPKSQTAGVGDRLRMTCTVHGGKPLVTSVNFSCPGHPDNITDVTLSQSVTSVLDLPLTSSDDGILCSCLATWKTRALFPLSSFQVLNVKPKAQADSVDSGDTPTSLHYSVYIILAVTILALIIIIIVAVFVFKLFLKQLKKDKRRIPSIRMNSVPRPYRTPAANELRATTRSGLYHDVVEPDFCGVPQTNDPHPHVDVALHASYLRPALSPSDTRMRHMEPRHEPQPDIVEQEPRYTATGRDFRPIGAGQDLRSTAVDRDFRPIGSGQDLRSTGVDRDFRPIGSGQDPRSTGVDRDFRPIGSGQDPRSTGVDRDFRPIGSGQDPRSTGVDRDFRPIGSGQDPRSTGVDRDFNVRFAGSSQDLALGSSRDLANTARQYNWL